MAIAPTDVVYPTFDENLSLAGSYELMRVVRSDGNYDQSIYHRVIDAITLAWAAGIFSEVGDFTVGMRIDRTIDTSADELMNISGTGVLGVAGEDASNSDEWYVFHRSGDTLVDFELEDTSQGTVGFAIDLADSVCSGISANVKELVILRGALAPALLRQFYGASDRLFTEQYPFSISFGSPGMQANIRFDADVDLAMLAPSVPILSSQTRLALEGMGLILDNGSGIDDMADPVSSSVHAVVNSSVQDSNGIHGSLPNGVDALTFPYLGNENLLVTSDLPADNMSYHPWVLWFTPDGLDKYYVVFADLGAEIDVRFKRHLDGAPSPEVLFTESIPKVATTITLAVSDEDGFVSLYLDGVLKHIHFEALPFDGNATYVTWYENVVTERPDRLVFGQKGPNLMTPTLRVESMALLMNGSARLGQITGDLETGPLNFELTTKGSLQWP